MSEPERDDSFTIFDAASGKKIKTKEEIVKEVVKHYKPYLLNAGTVTKSITDFYRRKGGFR